MTCGRISSDVTRFACVSSNLPVFRTWRSLKERAKRSNTLPAQPRALTKSRDVGDIGSVRAANLLHLQPPPSPNLHHPSSCCQESFVTVNSDTPLTTIRGCVRRQFSNLHALTTMHLRAATRVLLDFARLILLHRSIVSLFLRQELECTMERTVC